MYLSELIDELGRLQAQYKGYDPQVCIANRIGGKYQLVFDVATGIELDGSVLERAGSLEQAQLDSDSFYDDSGRYQDTVVLLPVSPLGG